MWLELLRVFFILYSISLCTALYQSIVTCLKKKHLESKERSFASYTKSSAKDGFKSEQPTQPEEDPLLQPPKNPSDDSKDLKSQEGHKKKDTLVGYKSPGPDNRAFTLIAKNLQQPDLNRTESMDTLDPLKVKRDSDIAIRKSKMMECRQTQRSFSGSRKKVKAESGSKQAAEGGSKQAAESNSNEKLRVDQTQGADAFSTPAVMAEKGVPVGDHFKTFGFLMANSNTMSYTLTFFH